MRKETTTWPIVFVAVLLTSSLSPTSIPDQRIDAWAEPFTADTNPITNGIFPHIVNLQCNGEFSPNACTSSEGDPFWLFYNDLEPQIMQRKCDSLMNCEAATPTGIYGHYPHVWNDGSTWRMVFASAGPDPLDAIHLALSHDGINWKYSGDLIETSEADWDSLFIHDPTGFYFEGNYWLVYAGRATQKSSGSSIGFAWSATGEPGSYIKVPDLLSPEDFNSQGLFDPEPHSLENGELILLVQIWFGEYSEIYSLELGDNITDWSIFGPPMITRTQPWEGPYVIEPSCIPQGTEWLCLFRGDSYEHEIGLAYVPRGLVEPNVPLTGQTIKLPAG